MEPQVGCASLSSRGIRVSREELVEAERLGPQGTLDLLMEGRPQATEALETLIDVGRLAAERDDGGDQLRGWWLYCMLQGGHPLREKLTLFWHNHFATSLVKVQNPTLMFGQNCLLREHALGRFGPMLQAMSRDGAMLVWLDSNSNVKGKPNENLCSRADGAFQPGRRQLYRERRSRGRPRLHRLAYRRRRIRLQRRATRQRSQRRFWGKRATWDGGDVVRIVLEQPAAARFLVRKLYRVPGQRDALGRPMRCWSRCASRSARATYDIAALVRTMLGSRHFYSSHAFRQRMKGPVEYVLGAVQAVYRRYAEDEPDYRPLPQQMLVGVLGGAGAVAVCPAQRQGVARAARRG